MTTMTETETEEEHGMYVEPNGSVKLGVHSFDVHGSKDEQKAVESIQAYLENNDLTMDGVVSTEWHANPDYPEVDAAAEGTYEVEVSV